MAEQNQFWERKTARDTERELSRLKDLDGKLNGLIKEARALETEVMPKIDRLQVLYHEISKLSQFERNATHLHRFAAERLNNLGFWRFKRFASFPSNFISAAEKTLRRELEILAQKKQALQESKRTNSRPATNQGLMDAQEEK